MNRFYHWSAATLAALSLLATVQAQAPIPANPHPPTSAAQRLEAIRQRQALQRTSVVRSVPARNIGPTVMSGRVVDVEVNPDDPTEMYVAYATGGVWHSTNNGLSFSCITDSMGGGNFIGDIAMHWPTRTLWVGSGENNSSRSSYAGFGLYVTRDNGKTWQHRGLAESHHIGRVVIHPSNPNTIWVASLGHLYSPSNERGIYKSTDGGATWTRTLFVNDTTGVVELQVNPSNPDILLAATWQKDRRAWNFWESGKGSAIYRSTDGGTSWTKVSGGASGFPDGAQVGRIGLDFHAANPNIVYAVLDNQARRPTTAAQRAVTRDLLARIGTEDFLKLSADSLNTWLDENNFPKDYTARSLFEQVRQGKLKPADLVAWLSDANSELFDTPVTGAELYRSNDGGQTWKRTHDKPIDDLFYSYGYYFAQVRVDPGNPEQVYLLGVPVITSKDGGKTWTNLEKQNTHSDHHALWVNPKRSGHLILGNDGGLNISYDDGKNWMHCNTPAVGQFYAVAVDNAKPYNVYGGLQDNGVWRGPSTSNQSNNFSWTGGNRYELLLGGDGMQVQIDPRDGTVYTGFQFGNYFRISKLGGRNKRITPQHKLGARPYRWNWQSPIQLSAHQPDILYFAGNKVFRSFDKGDSFTPISPDLTHGGKPGDVAYGTITSISESPLVFGLVYAGTDDGRVHVTRDGGSTWTEITGSLPKDLWVSRVEASPHDTATVFLSLNGYRWDHMDAYVYRSADFGKTWTRIGSNLPAEPVNVVRQDLSTKGIVYVGTDGGAYVSLDNGSSFQPLAEGLPEVPVHDIAVQNREAEILLGTHGRSLYIVPVKHVRQLPGVLDKAIYVFAVDTVQHSKRWGTKDDTYGDTLKPKATVWYYLKQGGSVKYSVLTSDGKQVFALNERKEAGLHAYEYGVSGTAPANAGKRSKPSANVATPEWKQAPDGRYYLPAGTYKLRVETTTGTPASAEVPLVVKAEQKPKPRQ